MMNRNQKEMTPMLLPDNEEAIENNRNYTQFNFGFKPEVGDSAEKTPAEGRAYADSVRAIELVMENYQGAWRTMVISFLTKN